MQGVCTVYSTTWKEETRKAMNPVSQLQSTPIGRHRQHDWPTPDKLSELAQDGCGWRKLVVACLQPTDDDDNYLELDRVKL